MKNLSAILKYVILFAIFISGVISCSENEKYEPIIPTSVTISSIDNSLNINEVVQLVAKVMPEEARDKTVTWLSSDVEIARVDDNGLVSCRMSGNVVIQATTNNNIKATIPLYIKKIGFKTPKELIGNWIGTDFALIEKSSGMIFDEEALRQMFTGWNDDMITMWLDESKTRYAYVANEDGTMEWHENIKLEDGTYEKTAIYGILSKMENIENGYTGTFDMKPVDPEAEDSVHDFFIENSRIKITMPWNNSFDATTYYSIFKNSSSNISKKTTRSKSNTSVPIKLRRK